MNTNKKVLVSDYDQTFYLNDEDIKSNIEAVSKFRKKGNIFIIATGRSYLDFQKKVNIYHFKYDYVILNHGAIILDKSDNVIASFAIEPKILNKIEEDLQLDKTISSFCCSNLESRVDFTHGNISKINARYYEKKDALNIDKIIKSKYQDYINSFYVPEDSLEIISNKTNKSIAINILLEKLNINKDNVYTIGDGYSDIEMVKNYNGYAMINSVRELKNIAIKEYESVSDLIFYILNQ